MQIIPCAVRSAHLWLKSAKVELTSDSFAQPKQHVQSLVFPHLQRQMSRNLLEDKDGNTKRSTKVAQQIWKDLLLEKNCWRTKREERIGFNPEVIYVDARKRRFFLLIGKPKNIEIRTQLTLQSSTKFRHYKWCRIFRANKVFVAKWAPECFRVIWAIQWFRVMRPLGEFALVLHFTQ